MLLIGAVAGLVAGLLLGGRLDALINVRLRYLVFLIAALVLRFGTQWLIAQGVEVVDTLRLPLYAGASAALVAALWLNRNQPGLLLVMVGVAANGLALVLNRGWMPVYVPALEAAALGPEELSATYHVALPVTLGLEFLLHGGPIADVIPFPVPPLNNVVSIGDVFISIGLGWFVLATLLRGDPHPVPSGVSLWRGAASARRIDLERPVALGGGIGPGLAPVTGRLLRHPFVRLARDPRFSAFWLGQTISFLGDRIHQVAIGALVLARTGSVLQSGLVFLAAALPNVFLGPIAGTLVDRWDYKRVMVVSDVLRGGIVLLVPIAAGIDLWLVYPLTFLVTVVSLFFRPAKAATIPRIVDGDELVAANSALWTSETIADIAGLPLAGLFVAMLGTDLALAFWLDSATYFLSAVLISTLIIPPVVREVVPRLGGVIRTFIDELRSGWRTLRDRPPLLQNTLVSAVAQISVGATIALTLAYVSEPGASGELVPDPRGYGAVEGAIGIGNLVGGVVIGTVGARLRKGYLVVTGFMAMGASIVALGLASSDAMVLLAAVAVGVFNLVYIVPTQTLFAELTPDGYLGRVVAIRSSIVFGVMAGAMAVTSIMAEFGTVSIGTVIAASGVVTLAAGVVAAFLPAVRDA
jgi:MFS family permease